MQLKKLSNGQFQGVNDGTIYTVKGNVVTNTKTGKPLAGADLTVFQQASANPGKVIQDAGFGTKTSAAPAVGAPAAPGTVPPPTPAPASLGVNPSGTIDPTSGTAATLDGGAPGTAGNTASTAYQTAANAFANNGQGDRTSAYNADLSLLTQNNATQQKQDTAAAMQSLANRGIAYSSDPDSQYQTTLATVQQHYDALNQTAQNQAIVQGDQTYATDSNAVAQAGSTALGFQNSAIGEQQNISSADLQALGLSDSQVTALLNLQQQKAATKQQNTQFYSALGSKNSGGGSSGSTADNSDFISSSAAP